MRNHRKQESDIFLIHFSSCQKGEDDLRELVHHGDHCLSMAEAFIPLLVVIGTEEKGIDDGPLSHDVDILTKAPVSVLCYMALAETLSGLVDGRIGAHIGDELLVGCEPGDVLYLCHEVRSGYLSAPRYGLEYLQLLCMHLPLMLYKGISESFVSLLKIQYLLCAVLDEIGVSRDSDAAYGIALDVLHGDGETASLILCESINKFCVISGKDLVWRCKGREKGEHGRCKYIDSKDFRPCNGKVALELCLGSGYILSHFLSSSCYAPHLIIHDTLLLMESIVIGKAVSCNAQSISAVSFCLSQRRGLDVVLDHYRILDTCLKSILGEEVAEIPVVASCGFHHEDGILRNIGKEACEPFTAHLTAASGNACSISVDDAIVELSACDVDTSDITHGFTSWVMKDGSPHPISRVNEALSLNQPIGIERELGQTPLEAFGLEIMPSSVPSIISFMTPFYGIYC